MRTVLITHHTVGACTYLGTYVVETMLRGTAWRPHSCINHVWSKNHSAIIVAHATVCSGIAVHFAWATRKISRVCEVIQ